ncbi:zinc-dependent alcohol dehydrogenase family protein [Altererythrobacter sp. ZODW24]|uniref:zinc-dependent alcohol dehydrogenase family protein n=1 Tax=Altererythrobacter sp. ZODW24 TaxID=2185142 RepID=UPI001F079525|nr:zinc-dependent alcohol dehydrogenase family protein [Altererythrobacter sp. ZODW24]
MSATPLTMRAMQLDRPGRPLRLTQRPVASPNPEELLVEVSACGVCRTDLHVVDGDITGKLPIVPGHEIVGRVIAMGGNVRQFAVGQRIGIPWLGHTCGHCLYCSLGEENLCDDPQFTGFTRDGGFASHVVADARYCYAIPDRFSDAEAAPLLCAGLIGYRSLRMAGGAQRIGFYGFGAAAHILTQIAVWQKREVYAFVKPGDQAGEHFARSLGCVWAGGSDETPPFELDAAIIFAPVGELVPLALRALRKGGRVICAGIHMSDIPAFPYRDLWHEKCIRSVANLTRRDGEEFFDLLTRAPVESVVTIFPLEAANEALDQLRAGQIEGAAVLIP